MRLTEKLKITPFLRIIVPFCIGIILAQWCFMPLWLVVLILVIIYVAAWLFRDHTLSTAYTYGAIFITGILLAMLTRRESIIPQGERIAIVAEINSIPVTNGRWQRTTAEVGYYRSYDYAPSHTRPNNWQQVRERIQLYVDTCYRISLGEQVTAVTYINPIDTTRSRYGALMRSRGMFGRAYIVPGRLITSMDAPRRSLSYYSGRMQSWAVVQLTKLKVGTESREMSTALVAGYRQGLDRELLNAYSRTGTSHILSVSGLHMGFVFILINLIFGWVVFFRRGHIIKNCLVILALWLYAMIAGLSPSVIRAALMFTAAQIALGTSAWGNSYNIILGAATVMLAVNPYYLFDISFQLSFLAVISIVFFYPRLYRGIFGRNRFTDTIWSSVLVGVAAQIGVLPLVAYNFGNIPLISIVINPIIVLTAFVIVSSGLAWLILGLIPGISTLLNPIVGFLTEWSVRIQNSVVLWAADTPMASVQNIELPVWEVWIAYLGLGGMALWVKLYEERRQLTPKLNVR